MKAGQPELRSLFWFGTRISVPTIIPRSKTATAQATPTIPLTPKYGFRDYRGGGRSSGRETIGRVAGGAIASRLLSALGIQVTAYTKAIGPYTIPADEYDFSVLKSSPLCMPHLGFSQKAEAYLRTCMEHQDSAGGMIECQITGLPAGIGEPAF